MPWFRLDDKSWSHPKVVDAGNAAWGALCRLGAYASDHLTDGSIPASIAILIASSEELEKLFATGLLERKPDGNLAIHDYLDRNPSAREVKGMRKKRSEAGRIGGVRSGSTRQANPQALALVGASHMLEAKANPSPIPSPSPIPKERERSMGATRIAEDWQPSPEQVDALRRKLGADPTWAVERFRNHFLAMATANKNAKKLRWDLAFANWAERDASAGKLPRWSPPAAPPLMAADDPVELAAARGAALEAMNGVKQKQAPFLFDETPPPAAPSLPGASIGKGAGGSDGPIAPRASSGQGGAKP